MNNNLGINNQHHIKGSRRDNEDDEKTEFEDI